MTKEGAGPQVVQAELDCFIELLFRDLEAYRLALKLYTGRYEAIDRRDARDILRQLIAKHMPREQLDTTCGSSEGVSLKVNQGNLSVLED